MTPRRVAIEVRGVVQGVGFRPHVVALARMLGVAGEVANVGGRVLVDAFGDASSIATFLDDLIARAPAAARVSSIAVRELPPEPISGFTVGPSAEERGVAFVAPDRAPCAACEIEHDEPASRRFGYPFGSCNACGPRWTVVREPPYERTRTTMSSFAPCADCAAELADSAGRHFLAETIACPACGPRVDFEGEAPLGASSDPIRRAAAAIAAGAIVAVKGVGGYHLACDASDASVVERLRHRKRRDAKPFALLVADVAAAAAIVELDDAERAALISPARPIVLCRRRLEGRPTIAAAVAPATPWLGVMTPPSLLHLALVRAVGRPIVLTSGNRTDEPMATDASTARSSLAGVADAFLHHDRDIVLRVDDSVLRVVRGRPVIVRRARGFAPEPLRLPPPPPVPLAVPATEPLLALGGDLKSAFAIAIGDLCMVSHHLGDLGDVDTTTDFERTLAHAERLIGGRASTVVHDLHPDYESTRLARSLAVERGGVTVAVPHHHAHIAACLGDNGHAGPAIGFAFDGLGFGDDGRLRGGEVLVGDLARLDRVAHLRFVSMPGGDRAARQPWRMALAHLIDAELPADRLASWSSARDRSLLEKAIRAGVAGPQVSSIGRLFDAVGCLVGLGEAAGHGGEAGGGGEAGDRGEASFEGQTAMALEGLAALGRDDGRYAFDIGEPRLGGAVPAEIDARPVVRAVVRDVDAGAPPAEIALRFHRGLADAVARVAFALRDQGAPSVVALSGGVFVNAVLLAECEARLEDRGFTVLRHVSLPPNDGCLAFGQLCLVSGRLAKPRCG